MITALLMAAATPEAIALGERLAASGTLASLAPLKTAAETEEMIAGHPELSDADKQAFRISAKQTADRITQRILKAEGELYAAALPLADLRALVAFAESDVAKRQRAKMPMIIAGTIAAMGKVDFMGDAARNFCAESGKLCPGASKAE